MIPQFHVGTGIHVHLVTVEARSASGQVTPVGGPKFPFITTLAGVQITSVTVEVRTASGQVTPVGLRKIHPFTRLAPASTPSRHRRKFTPNPVRGPGWLAKAPSHHQVGAGFHITL